MTCSDFSLSIGFALSDSESADLSELTVGARVRGRGPDIVSQLLGFTLYI